MPRHNLALSILNWNGVEYTTHCVQSLLADPTFNGTIFILDNGSTIDESVVLRQRFGDRILIERCEQNLGFAGGNNFVIKRLLENTGYEYICLLNQDAIVESGCMAALSTYLDQHTEVAVCGPLVLEPDGTAVQSCGATINHWTGKVISRHHGQPQSAIDMNPHRVDCVIGNCFMVRTSALERVGLLDEGYFAYYEETDWCVRARKHGFQCVVVPQAKIRHLKAGGFRTYLITRNMIWFQKIHTSFWQKIFFFFSFWFCYVPERIKKGSPFSDLLHGAIDGWLKRKPTSQ